MTDLLYLLLFIGIPFAGLFIAFRIKFNLENRALDIKAADLLEYLPNASSKDNLKFSYQKSGWTSGSLIVKNIKDEVIAEIIFRRQTYTNPQPYRITDILAGEKKYQVRGKSGLMGSTEAELFIIEDSGECIKIASHTFPGISLGQGKYFFKQRNFSVSTSASQLFNSNDYFEIFEADRVVGWIFRKNRVICSYMPDDIELPIQLFILQRESKWLIF